MDRAPARYTGGHRFDSRRGLRFFFVPRSCLVDYFIFIEQIISRQSGTLVLITKDQTRLPRPQESARAQRGKVSKYKQDYQASRNDNVLKLTSNTSLEQHTRKRLDLERVTNSLPALFTLVFLKSLHFFLSFNRIKIPSTNSNLKPGLPPPRPQTHTHTHTLISKPGLSGKSVSTNKLRL